MAWGIFKKIEDGFKKVIGGIKKGAQWLGDKVLKPIAKPIVNAVAPVLDQTKPGVGTALNTGVNALTGLTSKISNHKIRLRGSG